LKVWEAYVTASFTNQVRVNHHRSARCTSAAPTYFEPYKHSATNQVYIDGAMEKNNPVGIADSERKFIWPEKSENSRDIIVSIGTGYSTDYNGQPVKDSLSQMLTPFDRVGFLNKLALFRLVLSNTTNCEKMWNEFTHSLGPDPHLLTKCHRVNVPYGAGQDLCSLDAVSRMDAIKEEAVAVLALKSKSVTKDVQGLLTTRLDIVARQLVASLFYFQLRTTEDADDEVYTYHGLLRCRLGPSCRAQMQSLVEATPLFRVYEGAGAESNDVSLDGAGWDLNTFSVKCSFWTGKGADEVRVVVSLDRGASWDDVSGFPRRLGKGGGLGIPELSRVKIG
jgi:hypothetical protein